MAFTTNAALTITPTTAFLHALADQDPLHTALLNLNHLYAHYAPPLHSIVYTTKHAIIGRSAVFEWPTAPSADSIEYTFTTWIRTGTGTNTLTVLIEEWTGAGWGTIDSTAAIAAPATSVVEYTVTAPISATATKLRATYTRAASDPFFADGIIIYPNPGTPVGAGETSSGFIPYDTGLLTTAGAPLTTEHVNRCKTSALAVLLDRQQCVLSFVQEDTAANVLLEASDGYYAAGSWQEIGAAVCSLPGQKNPTITIKALATVNAGADTRLVRVHQDHPQGRITEFDADGVVNSETLELITDGGPEAAAVLKLYAKIEPGQKTYVHAVCGFWQPGD